MSARVEKVLIIPDMHVPYHDRKAFALVLKMAKAVGFDRLYTLGDLADFFKVSFHERTMGLRMTFGEEVREVNEVLDAFDGLGIPKRHFIAGNHEYRFDRYMSEKAPEISDLPGLSVPELFRLKQRGWGYTPYKRETRCGKLWLTHDEGTAGAMACVKARGTYEGNVVIGHCHSMTVSYQGNARGASHVGASFGWLGDLNSVDYMHQVKARRWQLGVGVGLLEPGGVVHLQAVPIINYKMAVFGNLFELNSRLNLT
jgi:hypothetical protein